MSRLFVTIFINNRMCQYKIEELIQNSSGGCINPSMVFGLNNVFFPLRVIDNGYYLYRNNSSMTILNPNNENIEKILLQHGNYLLCNYRGQDYSALVIDYEQYILSHSVYQLNGDSITIGYSPASNVVIDLNVALPKESAFFYRNNNGWCCESCSPISFMYVNNYRCQKKNLKDGDEIYIMGTTILYSNGKIWLPSSTKTRGLERLETIDELSFCEEERSYVRTARIGRIPMNGKFTIDPPPPIQKSKEIPFILQFGPSATMLITSIVSLIVTLSNSGKEGRGLEGNGAIWGSLAMVVCMIAAAIVWPFFQNKYRKQQEEKTEEYRREKYSAYLEGEEKKIKKLYNNNYRSLCDTVLPPPQRLCEIVENREDQMWERQPRDEDFLKIRFGIGKVDSKIEIETPPKGFVLHRDPMLDKLTEIKKTYSVMRDAPIALSLNEKKVIGAYGEIESVFKNIVMQLITHHSYDEVKLVLICKKTDIKMYHWLCDVPHIWSPDRSFRYIASNAEETEALCARLESTMSMRSADNNGQLFLPVYVFLIMDSSLLKGHPFYSCITDVDNKVGIRSIFFGQLFDHLPKECMAIINNDPDIDLNSKGVFIRDERDKKIRFDEISENMAEKLARNMNVINVDANLSVRMPDRVTFMDMLQVGNVEGLNIVSHWDNNKSERSLAAPIGIKTGGELFFLDIHERAHGSHGLVAGTTGSGKSEFLQAYILSMMIHYSPDEVAFVLVDFKGDAMARPFLGSPHLAATISNLSGNTLYRALISLNAEVKRRQELFNTASATLGVDMKDINMYQSYYKNKKLEEALPHLIIVIDEFAQLKEKHHEFMVELISISQVGRSLGIHLILATQRPSGSVSKDIWSNSRFKVCLKVLDKQDSTDMLERSDAAMIQQPGRAYVQVGYNEVFELIQSGYSGAQYIDQDAYIDQESVSVHMVKPNAERIRTVSNLKNRSSGRHTQIQKIMAEIVDLGKVKCMQTRALWCDPLPEKLLLENCTGHQISFDASKWNCNRSYAITLGMLDIPSKQFQAPYEYDFIRDGHLAIYGSSCTGKSTLVQTILFSLALRFSPEMFQTYILDFGGGGLASSAQMPHCMRYVTDSNVVEVASVMERLESTIRTRHDLFVKNNCVSYEAYNSSHETKLPLILFVIDNYSVLKEKMTAVEVNFLQWIQLARSCGVFLIVTGNSKNPFSYKLADHISNRIVLNMIDPGAYRDILCVKIPIAPAEGKGRGLVLIDRISTEVQFAVPFNTDEEIDRDIHMQAIYEKMREVVADSKPVGPITVNLQIIPDEQRPSSVKVSGSTSCLSPLEDLSDSLVIGYDSKTGKPYGFDLTQPTKVFVGTRNQTDYSTIVVSRLVKNNPNKKVFVWSPKSVGSFGSGAIIIEDIDEWILAMYKNVSMEDKQKVIFVVDGFREFFSRISEVSELRMENGLLEEAAFSVVTFDSVDSVEEWERYTVTGLYVHLVRSVKGVIVGGQVTGDLESMLASSVRDIPVEYRKIPLLNNQVFMYDEEQYAVVEIEEEAGDD